MKMAKKFLLILSIVALMVACVSVVAFAATGDVNTADLTPTTGATNTSYTSFKTKDGWSVTNSAVFKGGSSNVSPSFSFISTDSTVFAPTLNGKTSAKGTLTSPTLTTGIETLTFDYGLPFSDTKIGLKITVTDAAGAAQTTTISNNNASKLTKYSFEWTLPTPIDGNFTVKIENTAPSNNTGNKDRTAIWNLQWTSYEASGAPVEKTDAEKAQADLSAISVAGTVTTSGTVNLPTTGVNGSTITWVSDDSELALVDNTAGTVTYTVPAAGEADLYVTLTATVVNGEAIVTNDFDVLLDAPIKPLDAYVPVEGTGYKFAMLHTTNEKTYYITGSMNGYYMATTTDSNSAAIVYIENTDDGFYMYTINASGAKKYMNMTVSGTYVNATFNDTASTVYTYSTKINGPVATVNGTEYGFGTYGTYTTMGTNKTSYTDNYFGQFVEPVEIQNPITIEGAALNINSNIDMMYYVAINGEPTAVSAKFVFNGVTTTVTEYTIGEDGRYCFVFKGINPHQMADVITVTITADNFTATDSSMSVRAYYELAKEYLAENTKLLTLMSDVLVYGAAAQTYVGDTDALVTEGLELTPSTTEFTAPESILAINGEAFKSAALYLDHAVTVRFTVVADEDAVVRVTLNDKVQEYNVADLAKDGEGRYIVEFVDVYATEYNNTIKASIVGTDDYVIYSVNSYISEMANADDANLVALVKALYIYGVTADAYN